MNGVVVFKGDSRAQKYSSALAASDLLFSFMTEAELERWILQANWGAERYIKRFVSVPSSRALIVKWAEVMVMAQRVGRRIEVADAWIAATALLYDAPLVTNNPSDYSRQQAKLGGRNFASRRRSGGPIQIP